MEKDQKNLGVQMGEKYQQSLEVYEQARQAPWMEQMMAQVVVQVVLWRQVANKETREIQGMMLMEEWTSKNRDESHQR